MSVQNRIRRFNVDKMRNQLARDTAPSYYYTYRINRDAVLDVALPANWIKDEIRGQLLEKLKFWEKQATRKYVPKGYEIVRDWWEDFHIDYNQYRFGLQCRVRKVA